tara:strand:+ start:1032 stop:1733 length:702 start_codon:yes stop_codon:yes gene_type:complete
MADYKIEIFKRDVTSTKSIKKLRKEGNIPGVYYSSTSKSSVPFYITNNSFNEAVKSGARIFNINFGGEKQNVLFKSVQYHPVTDAILHIDLYGVKMDEAVNVKINISLIGDAVGVLEEGGVLNQPINELEIQCLPGDIPENIEIDISELKIGDNISAGSIDLDEKFTLITSDDSVIVSVTHAMREIEPEIEQTDEELLEGEEQSEDVQGKAEENKDEKPSSEGKDETSSDSKG